MTALADYLAQGRTQIGQVRAQHKALKQAKPVISLYKNDPSGAPGLIFVGRFNVRELPKYQFPMRKNVSSQGFLSVRAGHYLAEFMALVPNNPAECKNLVIRVDMYGGAWRWTGLGHHWTAETVDGSDVITFWFNDDMQHLQFILAPPNPLLPMSIFQFPRVWVEFGPGDWAVGVLGFLNIVRNEVAEAEFKTIFNLITDPFDFAQWTQPLIDLLNTSTWQMHFKTPSFLRSTALWNIIASRMLTVDSAIADALEDGQLCISYRRYFTAEGETVTGLLNNNIANGALVFEVTDRSGFSLGNGTFLGGTVVGGALRSILTWTDGFIEDTYSTVTDSEALYPNEYWQSGFLGTFAKAPGVCLHDSHWNDLQSKVTYSPSTAVKVIVGGDNPTADAIAKLIIESVGNLIGYFLLGGFDSLGTMAADVIMPFLVGTIAAWVEWINVGRLKALGWAHLHEILQTGAESNAWSLAALAALRGGFLATRSETSHQMVIGWNQWPIPGLHYQIGDRIMSTSGCLQRIGIDLLFVNQLEEMTLDGAADGAFQFNQKCGQNKAAMSTGERSSRMIKKALDTMSSIGVHLIS